MKFLLFSFYVGDLNVKPNLSACQKIKKRQANLAQQRTLKTTIEGHL